MIQIVPTHGKDYSSKQAMITALSKGKEFIILDITHKDNGRLTNLSKLKEAGHQEITIRYNQLRRTSVIKTEDI